MTNTKPRVGYVGVGLMGTPMILRLLAAGYEVVVWNRTREKILPVLEAGATEAESPANVTSQVDFVFQCLTDAQAVEQVVFGNEGISAAGSEHQVLVDFSSMRPDRTREFSTRLREQCGMGWVDAPVSGGVKGAEEGTLAIMAGGEATDVERVRDAVGELSARFTRMGPSGAGQVTKLCNQVIAASNLVTIAEAVSLAERSGVDASALPEALAGGFADSIPLQIFGPRFAKRQYEPFLGHVYTMMKDLDTARDLGQEKGAPLPMSSVAVEILRQIASKGYAEEDFTHVIRLFDRDESR